MFLNSLSFRYPTEPVTCYFSTKDDEEKKSDMLKSITLIPKEIKALSLFEGIGGELKLYTTFDKECKGFIPVAVDFNNPDNEGHIFIKIKNEGDKTVEFKAGDAVAQGVIVKFLTTDDDQPLDASRTSDY